MIARRRSASPPRRPRASPPNADRTAIAIEELRVAVVELRTEVAEVRTTVVAHREQTDRQAVETAARFSSVEQTMQREFSAVRGELDGIHDQLDGG
jgi:hypothetical protein